MITKVIVTRHIGMIVTSRIFTSDGHSARFSTFFFKDGPDTAMVSMTCQEMEQYRSIAHAFNIDVFTKGDKIQLPK